MKDWDWEQGTRSIREWVNGNGAPTACLKAELAHWLLHCADSVADAVGEVVLAERGEGLMDERYTIVPPAASLAGERTT